VGDSDYKNTQVDPGGRTDAIKVGGTPLRSIVDQGPEHVQMLVDSQPWKASKMFGVKEGEAADSIRASVSQRIPKGPLRVTGRIAVSEMFARGDIVYDEEHERKVTILKTCVAETKKHRPIHEVVDHRTGDKWRQRESKLRRL